MHYSRNYSHNSDVVSTVCLLSCLFLHKKLSHSLISLSLDSLSLLETTISLAMSETSLNSDELVAIVNK